MCVLLHLFRKVDTIWHSFQIGPHLLSPHSKNSVFGILHKAVVFLYLPLINHLIRILYI